MSSVDLLNGHAQDARGRRVPSGIGLMFPPAACRFETLARSWEIAESCGVDALFVEDHLQPVDDPTRIQLECYTVLAALAQRTHRVVLGSLVSPASFRRAPLLARMSTTLAQISADRFVLGLGTGWNRVEFRSHDVAFRSHEARTAELVETVETCRALWKRTVGSTPVPVVIGGDGEERTLPVVARYADAWNSRAEPSVFRQRNVLLSRLCEAEGRDPDAVARTVIVDSADAGLAAEYRKAGADLIIIVVPATAQATEISRVCRVAGR
jgi:alkanesulfonate monooxygenase SsuD/methylene tetrahydromethanopterin reductase-like flavin-dependent oxidoreductase (luciferase family)